MIRLCSRPQDRLIRVEVRISAPEGPAIGEADLTPLIEAQGLESRFRFLAVVGPRGDVILPLRADGSLPPNLHAGLTTDGGGDSRRVPGADARARPQTIEIAGTAYHYYEVPLDLSESAAVGDVAPVICLPRRCSLAALVAVPSLAQDFRSLSPLTRATFIGLLVLFLLSTPIVKLITIDRNASLHWLDVALIGLTVPLITAVLTVLLLVVGHANFLTARADATSTRLAVYLDRRIAAEIAATRRDMMLLLAGQPPGPQAFPIDGMRLFRPDGEPQPRPAGLDPDTTILGGDDDVGWIARRVQLVAARPGERPYFQRLRRRETLNRPMTVTVPPPQQLAVWQERFVVDQVWSIADGWSKLVVAFRATQVEPGVPQQNEPPAEAFVVLAIKQMHATRSLPMPEGFGYAIVDPETLMVLHHRDRSRAHVESFAPQFRRSADFQAFHERLRRHCALGRETAEPELATPLRNVRYGGVRTNMTLFPVCSAAWMAVVWYERPVLENVAVEAGALAAAMLLIATVIFGGLAILLALPGGKKHFRWLWPTPSLREARRITRMLVAAVGWAAFSVVSMTLIAGDALLLHALGTAFILIHLARIILGRDEQPIAPWAQFKQMIIDWSLFLIGTALLLFVALLVISYAASGEEANGGALARALAYLVLVLLSAIACIVGGVRTVGLQEWRRRTGVRWRWIFRRIAVRFRERVGAKAGPTRRVGSQRRQVALIISVQAAALVVVGIVPATAAYVASWDAKRLIERDADVERFEAAQAAAVRDAAGVLAGFDAPPEDPPPVLCYTGDGTRPWSPWAGYFSAFQTRADPTVHQHGFARNALRRWFREPARMVDAQPYRLSALPNLSPCLSDAAR